MALEVQRWHPSNAAADTDGNVTSWPYLVPGPGGLDAPPCEWHLPNDDGDDVAAVTR